MHDSNPNEVIIHIHTYMIQISIDSWMSCEPKSKTLQRYNSTIIIWTPKCQRLPSSRRVFSASSSARRPCASSSGVTVDGKNPANHHLTCTKPCKQWDICDINWWSPEFFPSMYSITPTIWSSSYFTNLNLRYLLGRIPYINHHFTVWFDEVAISLHRCIE